MNYFTLFVFACYLKGPYIKPKLEGPVIFFPSKFVETEVSVIQRPATEIKSKCKICTHYYFLFTSVNSHLVETLTSLFIINFNCFSFNCYMN